MPLPGDTDISDDAIRKATGHGRGHWYAVLDGYGDVPHRERTRRLSEDAPDVKGWWVQMITVDYERAHGAREVGQSCTGDYQVSCSKTVPWGPQECFERAVSTPFLGGDDWTEGATWETDEAAVEVRRVDPGKLIRWFWHDADGKSTVVLDFWPSDSGDKTQIRFGHSELASQDAREHYRSRWKDALQQITA